MSRPKVNRTLESLSKFTPPNYTIYWELHHCPISGLQWLTCYEHCTGSGQCLLVPAPVRNFTLSGVEEKGPWMPWFQNILNFLEKNEVHFTDDCALQPLPEEALASLKL